MRAPDKDLLEEYRAALMTLQEAAKQVSVIIPILQGVYFAVVSTGDLKKVIWGNWGWACCFAAPAFLWLVSLFLAFQVFVPPLVNPGSAMEVSLYERVARRKHRLLMASQYFMLAGLLLTAVNVIIYFMYIPPLPPTE